MGWVIETVANYTYNVLRQGQDSDCGPCCVAMVANLRGQGRPTSASVRMLLEEGAYVPSTKDRAGARPTALIQATQNSGTVSPGTELKSLQAVLNGWNIRSQIVGPAPFTTALAGVTNATPIIAHVTWTNELGHWVVVADVQGKAQFVLDPAQGLRINNSDTYYERIAVSSPRSTGAPAPARSAQASDLVDRQGKWTGWWLKIL